MVLYASKVYDVKFKPGKFQSPSGDLSGGASNVEDTLEGVVVRAYYKR